MPSSKVFSPARALERIRRLSGRTPHTSAADAAGSFAEVASYRDGAIYVSHFAGQSEWERHGKGDEIVFVVDGTTRIFLLEGDGETAHQLAAGEMIVVPKNTWHRFETEGVKLMTVTPQPTEHSSERPDELASTLDYGE